MRERLLKTHVFSIRFGNHGRYESRRLKVDGLGDVVVNNAYWAPRSFTWVALSRKLHPPARIRTTYLLRSGVELGNGEQASFVTLMSRDVA